MGAFAILFAAYMLGYSIYMTVHLFRTREKGKTDVPIWITLFTIFLSVLLAGMALVMMFQSQKSNGSSATTFVYQPSAAVATPSTSYRWPA